MPSLGTHARAAGLGLLVIVVGWIGVAGARTLTLTVLSLVAGLAEGRSRGVFRPALAALQRVELPVSR
ncbi:hypothetical protein [Deinococcus pimensis]|uniref:hypothetical protein n=1 Tax=Deinococcus pimensis TaxID=309888 RepID=UPI000480E0DD|nr:hypothetical protein [Deinococcus pimensis]